MPPTSSRAARDDARARSPPHRAGTSGIRVELDGRGVDRRRRHLARAIAVVRVADRRRAQVEAPVRLHAHRVEQLAAEELQADDALLRIVRQILLQQEQVVGQPHVGSRAKMASTCASDSTTWMRAPLPPWSGLSSAGQRDVAGVARAARSTSLNVIERGRVDAERAQQRRLRALAQLEREDVGAVQRRARPAARATACRRARAAPRACCRARRRSGSPG